MGNYFTLMFRDNPSLQTVAVPTVADTVQTTLQITSPVAGFLSPTFVKGLPQPPSPSSSRDGSPSEFRRFRWLKGLIAHFPQHFVRNSALSTAGFLTLHKILPVVLEWSFPPFQALKQSQKDKFVLYVASTIHHVVAAPWASQLLWRESRLVAKNGPSFHVDYTRNLPLIAWSTGYFIADFLATVKDAFKSPDFFFHHAAALIVIWKGVNERLLRFTPHFLICEWSTIFLNSMWMLRAFNKVETSFYKFCAIIFVLLFTLTRIINLPIMNFAALTKFNKDVHSVLGHAKWIIPAVTCLQFYWYAKILAQFRPLLTSLLSR